MSRRGVARQCGGPTPNRSGVRTSLVRACRIGSLNTYPTRGANADGVALGQVGPHVAMPDRKLDACVADATGPSHLLEVAEPGAPLLRIRAAWSSAGSLACRKNSPEVSNISGAGLVPHFGGAGPQPMRVGCHACCGMFKRTSCGMSRQYDRPAISHPGGSRARMDGNW